MYDGTCLCSCRRVYLRLFAQTALSSITASREEKALIEPTAARDRVNFVHSPSTRHFATSQLAATRCTPARSKKQNLDISPKSPAGICMRATQYRLLPLASFTSDRICDTSADRGEPCSCERKVEGGQWSRQIQRARARAPMEDRQEVTFPPPQHRQNSRYRAFPSRKKLRHLPFKTKRKNLIRARQFYTFSFDSRLNTFL